MSTKDLMKALESFSKGEDPRQVLIDAELCNGYSAIPVGSVPWLPEDEWDPFSTIVTFRDNIVRLVTLQARLSGDGAFKRLISYLILTRRIPVVYMPTKLMAEALERWGWKKKVLGVGTAFAVQYSPPKNWKPSW